MDWNIFEQLLLLNEGRLHMQIGFYIDPGEPATGKLESLLRNPTAVFVGHSRENQFFPLASQTLERDATTRGFTKEVRTIPDSHGRPVFDVYRFVRTN